MGNKSTIKSDLNKIFSLAKIEKWVYAINMEKLKKQLGVVSLFSIASGAMISSGLFVLPAIAFAKTGTAVILCYLLAAILIIPAMLSKAELATAMPKSGGTYFYVNRSLGALLGTFAGFTNWLSLALKSAFALIGIGIFLEPFISQLLPNQDASVWATKGIAFAFTVVFTVVNLLSVKESGKLQTVLVFILLSILILYVGIGVFKVEKQYFLPLYPENMKFSDFFGTIGIIFISYGGLTKIASVAAEVKDPGKSIPRSMFASFAVVSTLYVLSVAVTVGLVANSELRLTLTPLSKGASVFSGQIGWWVLALAAITAFITTANAGIMAASRSPFAMAEDKLIPQFFGKLTTKSKVPANAILLTSLFMMLSILFFDTEKLAKVASAMMLLLYILDCVSVIIMRMSGITTYRPQYKSPFFPYIQIGGIAVYLFLIIEMGWLPTAITSFFLLFSIIWYFIYSRRNITQESALIHLVKRISKRDFKGNKSSLALTNELRQILFERDDLKEDRFDKLIQKATIIDIDREYPHIKNRKELFSLLGEIIGDKISLDRGEVTRLFEIREEDSTTNIAEGLAIPHILYEGKKEFDITIIRSHNGISFKEGNPPVRIIFALAGSKDERNFYLTCLMSIAQIVSKESFKKSWFKVKSMENLRNLIRVAERIRK